jgi:hypothetical protein
VLGALVSPVVGQAVERWVPGIFQEADNALGNSPLYIKEKYWPWAPCTGDVSAAVMPGGPPAEKHLESSQGLDPFLLTASGVAVPWQDASLTLLLSARRPDDTLLIEQITPKIYKYQDERAAWTFTPPAGACGGLDARTFDLTLNDGKGRLVDKGITKGPGEGPLSPEVPTEHLGDAFTVAQDDSAAITIHVSPKDGYYEFGFDIAYSLNGQSRQATVGTPDDPYKSAGGTAVTSFQVDSNYKLLK